jgi:2-oxo-4-hydroxy-4-carboxy--5-ureidoimidazoline (OHCU) decarboxylase
MADIRDSDIRAAVERRRADDTKIMQKVNAVNREAFTQKLPGMLEHSMRLVVERMMNCLSKPQGTDLAKPETWTATTQDIAELAQALWHLEQVRLNWPSKE